MKRGACLALVMTLAACTTSAPPRAADHDAVIAAILQSQEDIQAARREYLRERPEEAGFLSSLFDHRLCVEPRTAGRPSDFYSSTITPLSGDGQEREVDWNRPGQSFPISSEGFPRHLRRASFLSICPSGRLRISNPRFEGQTARLFVETRCGGLCSGGGEVILRKVRGRWEIQEWLHQWLA